MGGGWPTQRRVDDLDDIDAWMAQRNANVALRQEAETVGRDLWDQATRDGQDLSAANPGDLIGIGADALGQKQSLGFVNSADRSDAGDSEQGPAPLRYDDDLTVAPPSDPGAVIRTPPSYGFATARPGDSISRLLGTSDPGAIGRFVSLNGLDGRSSVLKIGHGYAVPTSFDDATGDEIATGNHLLRGDNSRLAAARAAAANDAQANLFAQRLNAGLNVWTGEALDYPASAPAAAPPPGKPSWDQSTAAKYAAGAAGYLGGAVFGVGRTGYHTVGEIKDLGVSGVKLSGLLGEGAQVETLNGLADTGRGLFQYGRAALDDPSATLSEIGEAGGRALNGMNPFNAPMSGSAKDVFSHEFRAGANFGEAATNVVGAVAGGEVLEGLQAVRGFEGAKAANIAKFVKQGANPELAEYLAEPYVRMGHHAVLPARVKIPKSVLGFPVDEAWAGRRLPKLISDNPFNLAKPLGISRGDFYEYHYGVDPHFHGATLPAHLNGGKGWSGAQFGLKRYDPIQRVWKGTPVPIKAAAATVPILEGLGLYDPNGQEGAP